MRRWQLCQQPLHGTWFASPDLGKGGNCTQVLHPAAAPLIREDDKLRTIKIVRQCLNRKRRGILRSLSVLTLTVGVLCGVVSQAEAQTYGLRAGVSGDPDQFYAGIHYETAPLVDRLRFRPNFEVGVGDDATLMAFNIEFAYKVPIDRKPWGLYFGGGPALVVGHAHDDTDAGGGFNVAVGLEHRGGLFTEFKVGAGDSAGIKFCVGYVLR